MEYDVFICHASENKDFAEPLAKALIEKGDYEMQRIIVGMIPEETLLHIYGDSKLDELAEKWNALEEKIGRFLEKNKEKGREEVR